MADGPQPAPDGATPLTPAEAAAAAGEWLKSISTLTGAAALATTFGVAFAPNTLNERWETIAKVLLFVAISLVALAIVLAAMASSRVPVKRLFIGEAAFPIDDQALLDGIRTKVIASQRIAVLAAIAFLVALGLSLFGDKDPSLYLYTENAGTPEAARVVCGELGQNLPDSGIAMLPRQGSPIAITDQEVFAPFSSGTCPKAEDH